MSRDGDGTGRADPAASEPVLELQELAEEPGDGFGGRVQRSILRRGLAADLAGYAWFSPFRILIEYLGMVFSLASGGSTTGDGDS